MATAASASVAEAGAPPILDRRLVFVTGKGGVGKTSTAAALALLAARDGRRVLVCEMDAKGSLADAFDTVPLRFQPREIEPGLFAMAMNTEDSLREYLRLFVKVPLLGKIGPLAAHVRLRGRCRSRCQGDPGRRQALSTRCVSGTTTWSSSTPRRPGTSSLRSERRR